MSADRAPSLLFLLAGAALALVAGKLLNVLGAPIDDVWGHPNAREMLLAFAFPCVLALACAAILWRARSKRVVFVLCAVCLVAAGALATQGWLVVGVILVAPALAAGVGSYRRPA